MSTLSRRVFQTACAIRSQTLLQKATPHPCVWNNVLRHQSSQPKPPTTLSAAIKSSQPFSTSPAIKLDDVPQESDVSALISEQIKNNEVGRLFAVVHISGKQRKVTTGDIVLFHTNIEADIGEKIVLNKVLLVGGKDFTLVGRPILSPQEVRVEGTVIEKTLSHTRIISWYRKRQRNRRLYLHKNMYAYLRINSIELSPPDQTAPPLDITEI